MSALRASLATALAWGVLACTAGGVVPSGADPGGPHGPSPRGATAKPSRSAFAAYSEPSRSPAGPTANPRRSPARSEEASAGCGPSDVPVLVDDVFTPFSHQLSAPDPGEYPAIFGSGIPVDDAAEAAGGFPGFLAPPPHLGQSAIQLILVEDSTRGIDPGAHVFYGPSSIEPGEPLPFFVRRGGSVVRQELTDGQNARVVKETLGDRAVIVRVGQSEAALVHADPSEPSDFRPYHLYWSDGTRDWSIIAGVTDPRTVIDFAREIYCEP